MLMFRASARLKKIWRFDHDAHLRQDSTAPLRRHVRQLARPISRRHAAAGDVPSSACLRGYAEWFPKLRGYAGRANERAAKFPRLEDSCPELAREWPRPVGCNW